jgi:hypothetical protein
VERPTPPTPANYFQHNLCKFATNRLTLIFIGHSYFRLPQSKDFRTVSFNSQMLHWSVSELRECGEAIIHQGQEVPWYILCEYNGFNH